MIGAKLIQINRAGCSSWSRRDLRLFQATSKDAASICYHCNLMCCWSLYNQLKQKDTFIDPSGSFGSVSQSNLGPMQVYRYSPPFLLGWHVDAAPTHVPKLLHGPARACVCVHARHRPGPMWTPLFAGAHFSFSRHVVFSVVHENGTDEACVVRH